jgi:hypothetical protein
MFNPGGEFMTTGIVLIYTYINIYINIYIYIGMFNPGGEFMTTGIVPEDFLPLAFLPLIIQYTSTIAETIIGKMKGFDVSTVIVPSFSLFNFGSRSIYTTMPKNRNDIFDAAAISVGLALLSSMIFLFIGLQITASETSEVVATYPSISLSLLNTNSFVRQLLTFEFPSIFQVFICIYVCVYIHMYIFVYI